MPSSSNHTSFKVADLSKVGREDGEKERRLGTDFKRDPGLSFSQTGLEGIKPGENTQGSVTADSTAAYTLVLSLGGWMIPVRESKRRFKKKSAIEKDEPNSLTSGSAFNISFA